MMAAEDLDLISDDLYGDFLEESNEGAVDWVIALWQAVLVRAVADWVIYRDSPHMAGRRIWKQVNTWFFGPFGDRFNSFETLCAVLNLDSSLVRERVRRITPEQAKRLRSRRR